MKEQRLAGMLLVIFAPFFAAFFYSKFNQEQASEKEVDQQVEQEVQRTRCPTSGTVRSVMRENKSKHSRFSPAGVRKSSCVGKSMSATSATSDTPSEDVPSTTNPLIRWQSTDRFDRAMREYEVSEVKRGVLPQLLMKLQLFEREVFFVVRDAVGLLLEFFQTVSVVAPLVDWSRKM